MRTVLCAAALVSLCSAACADRIIVTSASATYFTQHDELEIVVTFDRPLNLTEDYFGFWAATPTSWSPEAGFSIRNDDSRNERDAVMEATQITYQPRFAEQRAGTLDYTLNGDALTFYFPFDVTGLESPRFYFEAFASGPRDEDAGNPLDGQSAIDDRVVHTPEPSSVVLIALGFVGLGVHRLVRRPRLRL